MTVGELRKKIKSLPANKPVYMLTDKSADNWDCDNDRWRDVHPLSYVTCERIYNNDMYGGEDEYNLILEVEEL
jgi:hypothetical protein